MSTPIHLNCKNCGNTLQAADINIDKAIAKCPQCDCVFSFEDELDAPVQRLTNIEMPDGIEVLKLRSALDIFIKWRTSKYTFLKLFTIIWDMVVIPFVVIAIVTGNWIMLAIISVHLAVAVGLTYLMIARMLNTTEINVNQYRLQMEHKPIPMPFYGWNSISVEDVDQVFCQRYVGSTTNNVPNYAFKVMVKLKNGNTKRLLQGLTEAQQALYVEQEIEEFLKIKDRRIAGDFVL